MMIGKILFRWTRYLRAARFRKKVSEWHSRHQRQATQPTHGSTWVDVSSSTTPKYDVIGPLESYSASSECLDELLDIFSAHPAKRTLDVSARVDEHVYSML